MPDAKQLLKLSWLLLALCFSMSAVAAQTVFVTDLSVIPLGAVGLAASIAGIGGIGSTLAKISSARVKVENFWLMVISDMLISIIAGLLAYFIAAAADRPPFQAASAILIAGLGGSIGLKKYLPGTSEVGTRAGEPGAVTANERNP